MGAFFGIGVPRKHFVSDDLNPVEYKQVRATGVSGRDIIPCEVKISNRKSYEKKDRAHIFIDPRIATTVSLGMAVL